MTDLVRHVVDGIEVAVRGRQAGAAPGLAGVAHDADAGDAAPGVAETDVTDVEVVGAHDLPEDEHVAGQGVAAAVVHLGRAAKHALCPHGPLGLVIFSTVSRLSLVSVPVISTNSIARSSL